MVIHRPEAGRDLRSQWVTPSYFSSYLSFKCVEAVLLWSDGSVDRALGMEKERAEFIFCSKHFLVFVAGGTMFYLSQSQFPHNHSGFMDAGHREAVTYSTERAELESAMEPAAHRLFKNLHSELSSGHGTYWLELRPLQAHWLQFL